MTLEELRERDVRLAGVERHLQACIEHVCQAREATRQQITAVAQEDIRLRRLGAEGVTNGFHVRNNIPLEEVRDAVVELGVFTLSDLANKLGCSRAKAKVELNRVMKLVKPAGKFGHQQMYEYCAPEGPGAAFEAQQRLRVVEDDSRTPGPQDIKQSILSSVQDKEIREAVREAISRGWELVNAGGRHPLRLVRDDCRPITIVSTPRSSGNAARAIRRQVRNAS